MFYKKIEKKLYNIKDEFLRDSILYPSLMIWYDEKTVGQTVFTDLFHSSLIESILFGLFRIYSDYKTAEYKLKKQRESSNYFDIDEIKPHKTNKEKIKLITRDMMAFDILLSMYYITGHLTRYEYTMLLAGNMGLILGEYIAMKLIENAIQSISEE